MLVQHTRTMLELISITTYTISYPLSGLSGRVGPQSLQTNMSAPTLLFAIHKVVCDGRPAVGKTSLHCLP